ncbi:MAG: DUF3410 domain-containing protein, partial [Bacteroidetes bacterium]|nr:DUF3410 domain-containing protein [Bacteroidota bacterium]
VGVGHVGSKIEKLARILGMKVLLNDPPRARTEGNSGFVSIQEILAGSDIITLHVPLNMCGEDMSYHLINEATIGLIKPGSWLINTSRGEVVDGFALQQAISNGLISGAVLDVWENEPVAHPSLLDLVTIATPHIAGYSADGKRNGTVQVVQSLGKHFDLPVMDWVPSGIPLPSEAEIKIDCLGQSLEKTVYQAILQTYDVAEDDFRFRSNPADFEILRGNYPVRREFPAYKITLKNSVPGAKEMLEALGFSVIESR